MSLGKFTEDTGFDHEPPRGSMKLDSLKSNSELDGTETVMFRQATKEMTVMIGVFNRLKNKQTRKLWSIYV